MIYKRKIFYISNIEFVHIFISWLVISFAFSWRGLNFTKMFAILPVVLIGTLTGFILHELAHKFVAIYFGAYAEYRMWVNGLIMALFLTLISSGSFVFAAPGAVYIFGPHINRKQNGIISIAGPLANFFVALIFLILSFFIKNPGFLALAGGVYMINVFLALFNMIPIPPLDGFKVFMWNKKIYFAFTIILILMFLL